MLALLAVVAVALLGLSSARQTWLINAWSLQFVRHAFGPLAAESAVLPDPPAGHARAKFWQAKDALQSGNPVLAETLIASQAAQGDPLSMRLMSDALAAQGDFAGALAIWQKAGDAASVLRVASQAGQAGRLEDALMAYQAAWRLDKESGTLPLVNFLLGSKQDYATAENVLRQSLVSFPNSRYLPIWFRSLGDALRAQKRWDEAAAAYESTIAQTQDDWAAHVGLGWVKYERGDGLQAAMSEFQKAINIPESKGNGQYAIAQALAREKRFEQADAWFIQALAVNPKVRWWYVVRGNTARQSGNLALAFAVYQEALARFPDYAPVYFEIAYSYQLNKQSAQAIAAIEQALVLMAPPNAYYYTRAGNIYEWAGDKNQALQAYRQALLIDPQNADALKGVERLGK
jgi:tetratricopeptide (TPR) repeat protein